MSDPAWCPARLLLALLVTLLLRPAAAAVLPEDASNSSQTLPAQARPRDETPPVLTLTEPSDGAIVTTPTIVVRGTVMDERPVTVRVEGHRVPVTAGAFDTDVPLYRGENHLEVEAQDDAGNRTSLTRTVRFEDLSRIQSAVEPLLAVASLPDLTQLTLAPDGAWLVTAPQAGRIYRMPTDGSPPRVLADHLRHPLGIAVAADGTIYVAERDADRILRLAPDGARTVVLDPVEAPGGLALGRPGELFITATRWPRTGRDADHDVHRGVVLRLDLATGAVQVVADGLIRPEGIVVAPDGTLWVAASGRRGDPARDTHLYQIAPLGRITPLPGPRLVRPHGLARDQLGDLWLTARKNLPAPGTSHEDDADDDGTDDDDVTDNDPCPDVVMKVTPGATWIEFATGLDTPAGLAFDPHGDLLVVEVMLGRMLRFRAPPAPQVAAPAPTNGASLSLAGTAEPSVQVVARGPAGVGTAQADTEGHSQVSLPLLPDQTNPIEVFTVAAAGAGLASAPAVVAVMQDGTPPTPALDAPPVGALTDGSPLPVRVTRPPPVLTLTEPSDGAIVTTPTIVVRGTVTDERPVTVRVEGHRLPVIAGAFTTEIRLQRKDLKRLS